jgi:hypothetical protein
MFSELEKNLKGKKVDDVETTENKATEKLLVIPKAQPDRGIRHWR